MAYKEMGYLPEAMVNYLVRLGWSHGDQELFTQAGTHRKVFLEEHVQSSPAVFNPETTYSGSTPNTSRRPRRARWRRRSCHAVRAGRPDRNRSRHGVSRMVGSAGGPGEGTGEDPGRDGGLGAGRTSGESATFSKRKPPRNFSRRPLSPVLRQADEHGLRRFRAFSKQVWEDSRSRSLWKKKASRWARSLSRCVSP